jgi:hypothetical protein
MKSQAKTISFPVTNSKAAIYRATIEGGALGEWWFEVDGGADAAQAAAVAWAKDGDYCSPREELDVRLVVEHYGRGKAGAARARKGDALWQVCDRRVAVPSHKPD